MIRIGHVERRVQVENKTILIVGASSGIGKACAEKLDGENNRLYYWQEIEQN